MNTEILCNITIILQYWRGQSTSDQRECGDIEDQRRGQTEHSAVLAVSPELQVLVRDVDGVIVPLHHQVAPPRGGPQHQDALPGLQDHLLV